MGFESYEVRRTLPFSQVLCPKKSLHFTLFWIGRYDHETDEDFTEMTAKEDEVIARFKLLKFDKI